jgi:hypothetical protein
MCAKLYAVGRCKLNAVDPQLESDWFQTFIPLNIDPGFNMGLSTCDSTCATTTRNPKTFGTSGTSRCCGSVIRGFSSSPNYATWRSRLLLSTAIRARAKENAPKRRWSEFPWASTCSSKSSLKTGSRCLRGCFPKEVQKQKAKRGRRGSSPASTRKTARLTCKIERWLAALFCVSKIKGIPTRRAQSIHYKNTEPYARRAISL